MATLFSHKIYGGVVDMGNRIEGSASVFTWAHSVHDKIMVLCVGGRDMMLKGKKMYYDYVFIRIV